MAQPAEDAAPAAAATSDLHGVFVVDDFYALTVPPAKGLRGALEIVKREDFAVLPQLNNDFDEEKLIMAVEFPVSYEVLSQLKVELEPSALRSRTRSTKQLHAAARYLSRQLRGRLGGEQAVTHAVAELHSKDIAHDVYADDESTIFLSSEAADDDEKEEGGVDEPHTSTVLASEVAHIAGYLQQQEREKHLIRRGVQEAAKEWLKCLADMLTEASARKLANALIVVLPVSREDLRRLGINKGEQLASQWFPVTSLLSDEVLEMLPVPTIVTVEVLEEWEQMRSGSGVPRCFITPIPVLRGDHLFRQMREHGTLRLLEHHGIYMGNGRVIHFSGNEFGLYSLFQGRTRTTVKATSIARFMCKGTRLRVKRYPNPLPIEDTLARAESSLSDDSFGTYDLFKNNCEHFARWCKTGTARSKQVEKAAMYGGIAAAAAGAIAIAAIMLRRK